MIQAMATFYIQDFYTKRFETQSTQLLLENPMIFSQKVMENYLYQITNHPLEKYLSYIIAHPLNCEITSKDITQLSNIEDCTTKMCKMMLSKSNCGLTLPIIASELHAGQEYKDNIVALTKYGENQVKTACQLGLTVLRNNLWYLTSVGYIFPLLPDDVKHKYLSISLLRDPFYSKVFRSIYEQETNLLEFMMILSESTQKRRVSSCMKLINIFIQQCRKESINIYPIIVKFN